jgi:hypothetical protein
VRRALAGLLLAGLALPGPLWAYEEAPVPDGGSLTGTVKLGGTPPRLEPIPVKKDRTVCGERTDSEALVVGPSGGVKNAVILVEGVTRGKKAGQDVVLDNAKCRFVPHVSVVMLGSSPRVRNSDPILHSTHGFWDGKANAFNLALPQRGQEVPIKRYLKKPGVVEIRCDAHTHMHAWTLVHDSPYFAVTEDDGSFRIDGIPPGKYRVAMWHQGFVQKGFDKDGRPVYDEPRRVTREVIIPPKGSAAAHFELK